VKQAEERKRRARRQATSSPQSVVELRASASAPESLDSPAPNMDQGTTAESAVKQSPRTPPLSPVHVFSLGTLSEDASVQETLLPGTRPALPASTSVRPLGTERRVSQSASADAVPAGSTSTLIPPSAPAPSSSSTAQVGNLATQRQAHESASTDAGAAGLVGTLSPPQPSAPLAPSPNPAEPARTNTGEGHASISLASGLRSASPPHPLPSPVLSETDVRSLATRPLPPSPPQTNLRSSTTPPLSAPLESNLGKRSRPSSTSDSLPLAKRTASASSPKVAFDDEDLVPSVVTNQLAVMHVHNVPAMATAASVEAFFHSNKAPLPVYIVQSQNWRRSTAPPTVKVIFVGYDSVDARDKAISMKSYQKLHPDDGDEKVLVMRRVPSESAPMILWRSVHPRYRRHFERIAERSRSNAGTQSVEEETGDRVAANGRMPGEGTVAGAMEKKIEGSQHDRKGVEVVALSRTESRGNTRVAAVPTESPGPYDGGPLSSQYLTGDTRAGQIGAESDRRTELGNVANTLAHSSDTSINIRSAPTPDNPAPRQSRQSTPTSPRNSSRTRISPPDSRAGLPRRPSSNAERAPRDPFFLKQEPVENSSAALLSRDRRETPPALLARIGDTSMSPEAKRTRARNSGSPPSVSQQLREHPSDRAHAPGQQSRSLLDRVGDSYRGEDPYRPPTKPSGLTSRGGDSYRPPSKPFGLASRISTPFEARLDPMA
jgi:hypothetical protein